VSDPVPSPSPLPSTPRSSVSVYDQETGVVAPGETGVAASPPAVHLEPGQTYGRYRILRVLGHGGMGQVFEAEELEGGRRLALKVLRHELVDARDRDRFMREGRLAASVSHPNTVYIFGSEEIAGNPIIAMELVGGGTLKDRVEATGPIAPATAVDLTLQIINGLAAAAAVGVLHRDVKPSNCFVDQSGTIKVGDFGLSISTLARDETQMTMAGTILGTPSFAPPEQLRGEALDIRADIYAVGATLYYLLTGRPPFDAPNFVTLVGMVLGTPPRPPAEIQSSVPKGLAAVVLRTLAKKPSDRPQSYEQLRQALVAYSSVAPTPATLGLRFGASVIDGLILQLLLGPLTWKEMQLGFEFSRTDHVPPGVTAAWIWSAFAAGNLASVLYYGLFEGLWGRSLGKAVLRLRVVNRQKEAPGVLRGLWRAITFNLPSAVLGLTLFFVLGPVEMMYTATGWIRTGITLSSVFVLLLLFSTARRRNGFAGLHELASDTRVITRAAAAAVSVRTRPRAEVAPVTAPAGTGASIGPYRILSREVAPDGSEVVTAYDEHLRRRVWVRPTAASSPPLDAARRELGRPARARWLTGHRDAGEAWDAFEAWNGTSLLDVRATPQPWSRVRGWLLELTEELGASMAAGERFVPGIEHVWVSDDGHAKLLDWPAPGIARPSDVGAAPDAVGPAAAQRVLHEVARRGLCGAGSGTRPVVPPPLSASRIVERLRQGTFDNMEQISESVRSATGRERAARGWRAFHLALTGLMPAVVALGGTIGIVSVTSTLAAKPDLFLLGRSVSRLNETPSAEERDALEILIAGRLAGAVRDPAASSITGALMLPGGGLQRVQKALADHPSVTADEVQQAESRLKDFLVKARASGKRLASGVFVWMLSADVAAFLFFFAAVPSILFALVFRGGLLLRGFGMAVVRPDGREASRARILWRALVAWSPVLFAAALGRQLPASPPGGRVGFLASAMNILSNPMFAAVTLSALLAVFVVGAVIAVLRPSRGLQDRIAGTFLVPR
jgi:hypothetical protein